MASAADLRPRPLWPGEAPMRGDFHFAIGIGAESTIVSKIIAAGTASRTNHVGIITDVSAMDDPATARWTMVEALADGVVEDTLDGAPRSTVIRLSDDPAIREAVAREAEAWADALPRFGYDWWTIGRIVVVGLLGRLSFLTVPAAAAPLVGPTVHSLAVTVGFEAAAVVSLYRLQRPVHLLARRLTGFARTGRHRRAGAGTVPSWQPPTAGSSAARRAAAPDPHRVVTTL